MEHCYDVTSVPQYGTVNGLPQYGAAYGFPQYGWLTDGYGNVFNCVSIQPAYHVKCGIPSAPVQDFAGYNVNVTGAPHYAAECSIPQYATERGVPQNGQLTDGHGNTFHSVSHQPVQLDRCGLLSAPVQDFVRYNVDVSGTPQYAAECSVPQYSVECSVPQYSAECSVPQNEQLTGGYENVFHGVRFQTVYQDTRGIPSAPVQDFVGRNVDVTSAPQYASECSVSQNAAERSISQRAAERSISQNEQLTDGHGNVFHGVSFQPIQQDTCGIPSAPVQDFVGRNVDVTSNPQYAAECSVPQYSAERGVPQYGQLTDGYGNVFHGYSCRPVLYDARRRTLSALAPDFVPNYPSKYVKM